MSVWGSAGRALAVPLRYAALVSGALPVLAFPAPNLEPLAWFGLVPGLLIMRSAPSAREAAVRGAWFGTGFMLAAHYWLAPNLGPALLLVSVVLGSLWTGVGVSAHALLRPPVSAARGLAALVVIPSWWLLVEWIRSWQALGGPWALLGTSQWQHPAVLALASVGGVWLLSFVLVAASTGIVIALSGPRPGARVVGAAATAVLVAAGPVSFALLPAPGQAGVVNLALVQPGVVHDPVLREIASQRLAAGLGPRHPGLILWGESSVAFDLRRDSTLLARIRALSAADGAQILVNTDSLTPQGKSKVAVLAGPRGIVASYAKSRLVPFGEYIPFRQQLGWLDRISRAAPVNMVTGDGAHVLTATLPGGRPLKAGVLICFEAAFPDMSRVDTLRGAQVIIYQTSDSTFQGSWLPAQHAALAAVRAAETGRPAAQAALTGVSAAFDARGRELAWVPTSSRGVAMVRLGLVPQSYLTPFDRIGDIVPWAAIGICVLSAALTLNHRARRKRVVGIMVGGNRRPVPYVSIQETGAGSEAAPHEHGGEATSSQQAGR
jgi:apolipoprotein N-acyltransferase